MQGRVAAAFALLALTCAGACAESNESGGGFPLDAGEAGEDVDAESPRDVISEGDASDAALDGGDAEAATTCGNGVLDEGEGCDGPRFGALSCEMLGFESGSLLCNAHCGVVVSSCVRAEKCDDGIDNDDDFVTDCEDTDCDTALGCLNSCVGTTLVEVVPFADFDDTTGRPATLHPTCVPESGPERVYELVAPDTEVLVITLTGEDVALSLRSNCEDSTSEIVCVNAGSGFGNEEKITVSVIEGKRYTIIADTETLSGYFTLEIERAPKESLCNDLKDNNENGVTDCDDPDCQSTASCAPGTKPVGASCFAHTECVSDARDPVCVPPSKGFAAGYCSEFCVFDGVPCPGDAQCVDIGLSLHHACLDGCIDQAECRPGYVCVERGAASKVCVPPVETLCDDFVDDDGDGAVDCGDPDCAGRPACTPGTESMGEPCAAATECASSTGQPICITLAQFGYPGGYCSEHCAVTCSTGDPCVSFFAGGAGVCLEACAMDTDCRNGYACKVVNGVDKACAP